jgi:hypothetical protein
MDYCFKSKTDLVRRWDVESVECILNDDQERANQIILNLLCNPFVKLEVFEYLINRRVNEVILEKFQEEFLKAQINYLCLEQHPNIVKEASALATATLMKNKCKKLDEYDGELRKTICSLLENEPMVNELYGHLFHGS